MLPLSSPRLPLLTLRTFRLLSTSSVSSRGGAIITGASGQEIHLPPAETAVSKNYKKWIYCPEKRSIQTSTHVGTDGSNKKAVGKVGEGAGFISPELAKTYARNSALRLLATVHEALGGDMTRVVQVTKLVGIVNAKEDFTGHASVINGCSEALIEALGEDRGVGVRVCQGAGSCPGAVTCDLEIRVRPP